MSAWTITVLDDGDQLRALLARAGGDPDSLVVHHLRAAGLQLTPSIDIAMHRCALPQVCEGDEIDGLIEALRREVERGGLAEESVTPTCDVCDRPQSVTGDDWNGETGNHRSCEENKNR